VFFGSAGDYDVAVGNMYVAALRYAAISMQKDHVPRATICAVIGVKSAQLERWIRYWRASQSVWRVPERQNLHADSCWLDNQLLRAVLGLVREHPLALLREHSAMLTAIRSTPEFSEIKVSKSTVDRMLRRLGYTRKVIIRLYHAANPERRRQHAVLRQMACTRCIVSIDETHTDGRDVLRRCGRSLRHERLDLRDLDPCVFERVSTTMAVGADEKFLGLHSVICERALTSHDWLLFLGRLLPALGRYSPGVP